MAMAKNLENYRDIIENFKTKYFYLYENHGLNMSLKFHIIIDHYSYYFEKTGKTLRDTSSEYLESCHSTLRKHEDTHNFKVAMKIGTPIHKEKSHKSLVTFNSKNAGALTPLRMRRKSSPHFSFSSPSSFSPLSTRVFSTSNLAK